MKTMLVALPFLMPAVGFAGGEVPLDETNFVEAVQSLTKDKIVELLGQPASTLEVKDEKTGELIGYAWDYEYLNTSAETGDYYKTTELDLVDDHVVTIVFSNGRPAGEDADAVAGECAPSC